VNVVVTCHVRFQIFALCHITGFVYLLCLIVMSRRVVTRSVPQRMRVDTPLFVQFDVCIKNVGFCVRRVLRYGIICWE
jgi:hypothetical protein